jgi:hypothetical protein
MLATVYRSRKIRSTKLPYKTETIKVIQYNPCLSGSYRSISRLSTISYSSSRRPSEDGQLHLPFAFTLPTIPSINIEKYGFSCPNFSLHTEYNCADFLLKFGNSRAVCFTWHSRNVHRRSFWFRWELCSVEYGSINFNAACLPRSPLLRWPLLCRRCQYWVLLSVQPVDPDFSELCRYWSVTNPVRYVLVMVFYKTHMLQQAHNSPKIDVSGFDQ